MADGVPDSGKCLALVTSASFGAGAELGELLRGELGHLQEWSLWQCLLMAQSGASGKRDILDQCGLSFSY